MRHRPAVRMKILNEPQNLAFPPLRPGSCPHNSTARWIVLLNDSVCIASVHRYRNQIEKVYGSALLIADLSSEMVARGKSTMAV